MTIKTLLVISATVLLSAFAGALIFSFIAVQPTTAPVKLGAEGDTNLTNLSLSGNLSATGTFSAGTSTVGNLSSNAGILSLSVSTSTPTSTLTAAQVCGYGTLQFPSQTGSSITTGTITFPASSTLNSTCIAAGAHRTFTIQNLGSATSTIVFSAGGGTQIAKPPAVGSSTPTIVGGQQAYIDIVNGNGTDTITFLQVF
jgi:hypothetical protein